MIEQEKMLDKKINTYRAAINEKFPQLVVKSFDYLSEGWDSVVCRVNGELIFRFPKRAAVEGQMLVEMRLLPHLALPLPIPQPSYLAETGGKVFPFAFAGYPMLPGIPLEDCSEEVQQAEWWQMALAEFLTALHAFPVAKAYTLGVQNFSFIEAEEPSENWREGLENLYRETRAEVFPLLPDEQQDTIADQFEAFLDEDRFFEFEPVVIHGDLTQEHLLLDPETQRITGIIDFGKVGIGDPAYEVWESLLPYYRGKIDPTWQERRQFYSRLQPLYPIIFGNQQGDSALIEYGLNLCRRDF
ncbi:MAG: aminoglycoside phosphotransferase family protein [Chloroflexi bacterium]|nr:aminoglycoside phosphotransferase family protein [Chloroflexota bacterium]